MSGQVATKALKAADSQLRALVAQWPQDVLRPNLQFQKVLSRRIDNGIVNEASKSDTTAQANALRSLLANRYQIKYKPSDRLMEPRSRPTYYTDLLKELEEAPHLTWWGGVKKSLSSMLSKSYTG